MLQGKDVSFCYKNKKRSFLALRGVSFELRKGRITTFMGKSGCGKTSLLKCLANIHSHYQGQITWNGKSLKDLSFKERAATIGFVMQDFHLFPHLSVIDNCTLSLIQVFGMSKNEAEGSCTKIFTLLGIEDLKFSFPGDLSGGQKQRVAIARSLVLHPEVLLMDEPTSALDPESKKSLETLLLQLHKKGITIALSSHDMPFIKKIMDYVYFMENGEIIEELDSKIEDLAAKEKIPLFLMDT